MDPSQITHPYQAFPPQGEAYPPQGQAYPPQEQPNPPQGQPYSPQGQPYPPQGQAYPPQGQPYPPQGQAYPPQGQPYPPQGQPNPPQGQPYSPQGQPYPLPSYGYQPQPATSTNTATVVALQPKAATTVHVSPPKMDSSGIAICALFFSICTLLYCGLSLICLTCIIPALILSIVALGSSGSAQENYSGISIGLNMTVVICTVLFLVIVLPIQLVRF